MRKKCKVKELMGFFFLKIWMDNTSGPAPTMIPITTIRLHHFFLYPNMINTQCALWWMFFIMWGWDKILVFIFFYHVMRGDKRYHPVCLGPAGSRRSHWRRSLYGPNIGMNRLHVLIQYPLLAIRMVEKVQFINLWPLNLTMWSSWKT